MSGNTSMIEDEPVPFFGDQLTRVRLQGAKQLRTLSRDRVKRFDDIGPFVITLWHNKQDFLHVRILLTVNNICIKFLQILRAV